MDDSLEDNPVQFIDDKSVKETIELFDEKKYNSKRGLESQKKEVKLSVSPTDGLVNEIENEFESFQKEIKFKDLEDAGIFYLFLFYYIILYHVLDVSTKDTPTSSIFLKGNKVSSELEK